MRSLLASVLSLAAFASPTLVGAAQPKEFLAVYSNMCVSSHSGDLRGERMIVYRTGYEDPSDKTEQIWMLHQRSEAFCRHPSSNAPPSLATTSASCSTSPRRPTSCALLSARSPPRHSRGAALTTTAHTRSCSPAKPTRRTDSQTAPARQYKKQQRPSCVTSHAPARYPAGEQIPAVQLGSTHQVGRPLDAIAEPFVKGVGAVALDAGVERGRGQAAARGPGFGLAHQRLADAAAAD